MDINFFTRLSALTAVFFVLQGCCYGATEARDSHRAEYVVEIILNEPVKPKNKVEVLVEFNENELKQPRVHRHLENAYTISLVFQESVSRDKINTIRLTTNETERTISIAQSEFQTVTPPKEESDGRGFDYICPTYDPLYRESGVAFITPAEFLCRLGSILEDRAYATSCSSKCTVSFRNRDRLNTSLNQIP